MKKDVKTIAFSGAYSSKNVRPKFIILTSQVSVKSGLCKIYLEINYTEKTPIGTQYKRKRIDTDLKVNPSNWSTSKEEVKPKDPNHIALNKKLKDFLLNVNNYLSKNDSAYSMSVTTAVAGIRQGIKSN